MPVQPLQILELHNMKQAGERIAVLTAYDASFTQLVEAAGVEVLLVGDSLGMVVQGHDSTRPVTMRDMCYHTSNVARVRRRSYLVSDMPYRSCDTDENALINARRLIDAGADMVKIEGGHDCIDTIRKLIENGIPVCGHLGLLPQSVATPDGYRVQGREPEQAVQIANDAVALQAVGIELLVLECIPAALAKRITASLSIPVIGIGAGIDCDGQVLVIYDLLGMKQGKVPRFVRNFLADTDGIEAAIRAFVRSVKEGSFPSEGESYGG